METLTADQILLLNEYQKQEGLIFDSLEHELEAIMSAYDLSQISSVQRPLELLLTTSTLEHSKALQSASVGFYEGMRSLSGVKGRLVPKVENPKKSIEGIFNWGFGSLYGKPDIETAKNKIKLAADAAVTTTGKGAVFTTGIGDNTGNMTCFFERHVTGACCDFCEMLAGRGAVYLTAQTAGEFRKFHHHCRCSVIPVWKEGSHTRTQQYRLNSLNKVS